VAAAASARHRSTFHTQGGELAMKLTHSLGMLLLAVWLILTGLIPFVPALGGLGIIMNVLAVIAGLLLLVGR
jgi:hypothetical protein